MDYTSLLQKKKEKRAKWAKMEQIPNTLLGTIELPSFIDYPLKYDTRKK